MRRSLPLALLALVLTAVPASGAARAVAASGDTEPSTTQHVVTSFDGTKLYATLVRPPGSAPTPLVLKTHGWGGDGAAAASDALANKIVAAGYTLLAWDSRGFGQSGGESHVDNPLYEGKDASRLIDWAVSRAIVQLRDGDPVVGMAGGSYAGGIQTAAAALDPRIDAITPHASWSDLRYSLYPHGVSKIGWGSLLYAAGNTALTQGVTRGTGPTGVQTGRYASGLDRAFVDSLVFNELASDSAAFFAASSLAHYDARKTLLKVPTLVAQGSVDTLFNLTDGYGIYEHAQRAGAPAKFIAFCGGHVACPADYGDAQDGEHVDRAILTWFAKYLRGQKVSTGAPVEYRTNVGSFRSADGFAPSNSTAITGSASGALVSSAAPDQAAFSAPAAESILTAAATRDGDPRAVTAEVFTATRAHDLVGVPRAELEVTGTGEAVHLYIRLIHRETGHVVNLQEAAVRLEDLTAEPQKARVTLPGIAYTLPAGDHLDLQVSTTSSSYSNARVPALVSVKATVTVPSVPAGQAKR